MANHYYDATGVLLLDRVTPIIIALFGGFHLNPFYPGDGQAFVARIGESDCPPWDDIRDRLSDLARDLGVSPPSDDIPTLPTVLDALAAHFGTATDDTLRRLLESRQFDGLSDLDTLFLIASRLDDGHHLTGIAIEGCWYCDKPQLFEFGGAGHFVSAEVRIAIGSSEAIRIGRALRDTIVAGDLEQAAIRIAQQALDLLAGITDASIRKRLHECVVLRLTDALPAEDAG